MFWPPPQLYLLPSAGANSVIYGPIFICEVSLHSEYCQEHIPWKDFGPVQEMAVLKNKNKILILGVVFENPKCNQYWCHQHLCYTGDKKNIFNFFEPKFCFWGNWYLVPTTLIFQVSPVMCGIFGIRVKPGTQIRKNFWSNPKNKKVFFSPLTLEGYISLMARFTAEIFFMCYLWGQRIQKSRVLHCLKKWCQPRITTPFSKIHPSLMARLRLVRRDFFS